MYNKNVSEKVRNLSEQLETAESGADFFKYVTEFYKDFGVGMFGLNKAFRIAENGDGSVRFLPINNMDAVMLDDLIGYELQKKKLVENTQAFCDGKRRTTSCCSATAVPVNPRASRRSLTSSIRRACA